MGISFKVSKAGTRYLPKPIPLQNKEEEEEDVVAEGKDSNQFRGNVTQSVVVTGRKRTAITSGEEQDAMGSHDHHVSFALCLYLDGYTIGKASEGDAAYPVESPHFLHPYDRASESLFSAIEAGRLPGDILDDIPCKYINGMIVCEVRDHRKYSAEGVIASSTTPIVNKVRLRMTLETVVKDIPLISDNAWTYGDLMEVESRILKALQPKLCLDPKPKLDRLSSNPTENKVNFGISSMRKRARRIAEVTAIPSSNIRGKKVFIDRVAESSMLVDSGNMLHPSAIENLQNRNNGQNSSVLGQRTNSFGSNTSGPLSPLIAHPSKHHQMGLGSPRLVQDNRSGAVMNPGVSLGQDMLMNYTEALNSGAFSIPNKREGPEGQSSPMSNSNKRHQQQHQLEGFHGSASQWKNLSLQQQPSLARGLQYGNPGLQKYQQQVFEGGLNPEGLTQGMRYTLKEEPVDSERMDKMEITRSKSNMSMMESELNHMDSTQQSRLQQNMASQVLRSNFPQAHWNNSMGHPLESNPRNNDAYSKRKVVQSPRASAGGVPQSPLSSKSGEFSSGSIGGAGMNNGFLPSQKDRSVVTSAPQIGPSTSWTSSANDSMQRQNQTHIAPKRRSNSVPKTPAMSGVGSPASVSNSGFQANVGSPSVSNLTVPDPSIIERFSKIDMVMARYQLNRKKDKAVDQALIKSKVFPSQELLKLLSTDSRNENFNEDKPCMMPLSRSLTGGSMNVCKVRVLNFMQTERIMQGNSFLDVPKSRTSLIMSEKQNDGLVALHIGEIDINQCLAGEDFLPTLPNTHYADLLAAQFVSLMIREGYLVDDHVQPKAVLMPHPSPNQSNTSGSNHQHLMAETQQFSEGTSSSQPAVADMAKSSNSNPNMSSSHNNMQNTAAGMAAQSGNNVQGGSQGHVSGMTSSFPSRSQQQQDPMSSLLQQQQQQQMQTQQSMMQQPQQQQQQQFQRSSMMLSGNNQGSHLNSSLAGQNLGGAHMGGVGNRPTPLQIQLLQQQAQPQQQQQQMQQRKMMMGLGNVGMGNMGNSMAGLGAYNNVMNMAGVRGMGVSGISTPLPSMGGIGNMAQNSINLGQASNVSNIAQQYRSGSLTHAQAALMASKLKIAQSRGSMLGTPQSVIGAMTGGARQMHANPGGGLSMLNPTLNRANINPLQQRAVGQMGPPKLMAGMNAYMTQQQQQQLQMHQQQQLQLQQQQQQMQLQQQHNNNNESSSSLQSIVTSPQVGSPSNMGMPQTINQQQNQQQQQASPQQMSQRASMSPQLSSGAMHTGNPETGCPASPQLSSQTLGSVSNSPLDIQTVNKNNSGS